MHQSKTVTVFHAEHLAAVTGGISTKTDEVSLSATKVEFNNMSLPIKFSWDTKANQGGVVTPTGAVQYLPPSVPPKPPLPGVLNVPPPVPSH